VCNTCFKSGKACSHNDDFNEIANEILNADGIVFAFPVYWYFFPACIKLLIDKFYSFWIGGHTMKGKKVALISCCEEDNMEAFDSINIAFDKSFHLLDADIVGKVEIKGVNEAGAIRSTDGELRAAELVELL
jgi:multimeric flavodoxin WrbA